MTTSVTRIGAPVWTDLMTSDLEAAKSFYGQLFGWTFADGGEEFGHYHNIFKDGTPIGGAMSSAAGSGEAQNMPPAWDLYLLSADAQATTRKVTEHGGQVLIEPMQVGDLGTMAVFQAPSGARIGAWQCGTFTGFELPLTPGTPCWFETLSTSYDADLAFYRDVFDWDVHTISDEGWQYATHGHEDSAVAGICSDENVSSWRTYFQVADTDQAVERVKELGGRLLDGPKDSPYGRLATVADPQGASFQIIQAPQKTA